MAKTKCFDLLSGGEPGQNTQQFLSIRLSGFGLMTLSQNKPLCAGFKTGFKPVFFLFLVALPCHVGQWLPDISPHFWSLRTFASMLHTYLR